MPIPDDFMQELRMRTDITEIVSSYVNLKRRGRNLVGLCPFHGEKTPSFNIYPETGSFYCFGCGAGGDVITFIRRIENLDYLEAVKLLAQRAGMTVPENTFDNSNAKLKMRILEANREAARFFNNQLYTEQGKPALDYLHNRQLTDRTIRRFGLGFAPNSRYALLDHLKKLGFTEYELQQANLCIKGNYDKSFDRFYNRVMFPIIDLRGNVIAFGGRIMGDGKPKYLNTSDTLVFKKSGNLFALNFAKASGESKLILAEGYMDVIALHQAGFKNAVATLGTALTSEQALLMKRYTSEVIISYDADEAGQKATTRAISLLRDAGIIIRVLTVPNGKDPDEFIKSHGIHGPARFKQLIDNAGNDIEYKLQKIKARVDTSTSQGKIIYINEVVKVLAEIDSRIEWEIYASKIGAETSVDKSAIIQQIEKQRKQMNKSTSVKQMREIQKSVSARGDRINPQKADNLRAAKAEEALIAYIINNQDSAKRVFKALPYDKLITDFNKKIYKCLEERITQGKSAMMMDISENFSPEENARIAYMLLNYSQEAATSAAIDEYIGVILQENENKLLKDVAAADESDIQSFLDKLKQQKR